MDLARLQPNTFTSRLCEHPPEVLWPVLSDPRLLPDLSSELQAVHLSTDVVERGTVFTGDQLRGERRWTTTSTVTGFEPPVFFEWTVGDLAHPVSRWSFLVDREAGVTTVTHRVVLCGGPSPIGDRIAAHPDEAEAIVVERLLVLRDRMGVTLDGLLGLVDAR